MIVIIAHDEASGGLQETIAESPFQGPTHRCGAVLQEYVILPPVCDQPATKIIHYAGTHHHDLVCDACAERYINTCRTDIHCRVMTFHRLAEEDSQRIHCQAMECERQATWCEHAPFQVGNIASISFWYYCDEHQQMVVTTGKTYLK